MTLYPFYITKKTKMNFTGFNNQVSRNNLRGSVSADFHTRVFLRTVFERSITNCQTTNYDRLFYLAKPVIVTLKQELQTFGISSNAINHLFNQTLLVFADFFTMNVDHTYPDKCSSDVVGRSYVFTFAK